MNKRNVDNVVLDGKEYFTANKYVKSVFPSATLFECYGRLVNAYSPIEDEEDISSSSCVFIGGKPYRSCFTESMEYLKIFYFSGNPDIEFWNRNIPDDFSWTIIPAKIEMKSLPERLLVGQSFYLGETQYEIERIADCDQTGRCVYFSEVEFPLFIWDDSYESLLDLIRKDPRNMVDREPVSFYFDSFDKLFDLCNSDETVRDLCKEAYNDDTNDSKIIYAIQSKILQSKETIGDEIYNWYCEQNFRGLITEDLYNAMVFGDKEPLNADSFGVTRYFSSNKEIFKGLYDNDIENDIWEDEIDEDELEL